MALLTMVSMGAWAQIDVQIANDGKFDGGTIKYVDQTKPDEKGFVTVTITVTPNKEKGYTIKKGDISVYSTLSPSGPSAGTRALEIADDLTLYFKGSADADTDDLSAERDYTFNVPSGFGAWVKEATFHEKNRDGAKGTDYSGVYYIAMPGTGSYDANPASNYYLVPTEGWCFFVALNSVQAEDNGQPFLTTYKCGQVSKAKWSIQKHATEDRYYIIHVADGKYLTYNVQLSGAGENRVRVHLEASITGDNNLFTISKNGDNYFISPENGQYLNVTDGNKDSYAGAAGKNDGPTGYKNVSGIIGRWNQANNTSQFRFEEAVSIDPPTITNNFTANNTITIAAATGATIYYTTDGNDPTMSEYTGTGTTSVNITIDKNSDVQVIKAIAKATVDNKATSVTTYSLPVLDKPTIKIEGSKFKITAVDGASVYYTTNDTEATPSSTLYTGPFDVGSTTVVRAIVTKNGYYRSGEASYRPATIVHSSSEITDMDENYLLGSDFTLTASIGTSNEPFRGSIDGNLVTLSGLDRPLVAYAEDAIIKNVILDNVNISSGTNVGAICGEAKGDTRIYNCGVLSGSIGGSNYVGGIVGKLDDASRVINCFSYATITGGTDVGGIVGYNNATTKAGSINTMVMNCMFYGDITGGSTVSPIYGGNNIANLTHDSDRAQDGLNTFNYYAYEKLKTEAISDNKYNSALAVEDKYLTRFEYYRLLLNSNKKLAAFYATGSPDNADQMAKWVLETADRTINDPKPYPVLKAQGYYPSIINPDFENAPSAESAGRNKGGKLGTTLSVTINGVGSNAPSSASITNGSLTLQRTDKDFDRFNFNYDKVQLPYYNEVGTGNYTGNKVVTGWKITAITAIEGDPYTSENYPATGVTDFPNHNYADRKSSNKDLYSVSKRVFSQGAYFDVPYGVSSITIEPYWGNAIYVADQYYDVVYKKDYTGKQGVSQTGTQVSTFNGQSVKNSITDLGSGTTVYDNAVVLVGNFHLDNVPSGGSTPFTMMSVDEDNDHEPDYSLIYHHKDRTVIAPIRFDFLNIPGTAQAQKPNGASLICNFTIFKTKGWFEVTNTSSFYTSQLEYENQQGVTKSDAPLILLGGVIDQFVSTQSSAVDGHTIYIHVGGNVWIKEFGMGTHSDGSQSTPHVPVSVTGGEFPGFYLTGTYKADAQVRTDNAECYISGGYIHEAAGASLEKIDGDVHWQIYNADIDNFFGGGINDAKPITGDITTDIFNSYVTLFCGGPKFGNMQDGKKVTTNAEGCTFGKYFGAGYGGTSIAKKKYYDKDGSQNWATLQGYYINSDRGKYFDGSTTQSSQTGKDYGKKGPGVATDFDYEFFVWTSGATGARFYVKFVSFSLAQCNDVSSTLKNCTVETNFYGGGNLGKVVGTATSVLEDCTVKGSVYGAGYSASLPTVEVRDAGFTTDPNYNSQSGMFEPGVFSGTTTFTWQNATAAGKTLTNGQSGSDLSNHILYTNTVLTGLGEVAKSVLTINGTTTVAGSVYGGGEESGVDGSTEVTIAGGTIGAQGLGGAEYGNVYGGGKGKRDNVTAGLVKGSTKVTISQTTAEKPTTVYHNVYGGGAYGSVGDFDYDATSGLPTGLKTGAAANSGKTEIYVTGGTIGWSGKDNGMVFGSSRGDVGAPGSIEDKLAWVYDTHVAIGDTAANATITTAAPIIKGSVYGGGENGHNFRNSYVRINGGTIGIPSDATYANRGNVYGGGCGTDKYDSDSDGNGDTYNPLAGVVQGNAFVNMTGGFVVHNVYGAGAMGSVGSSTTGGKTTVSVSGGRVGYDGNSNGNVYGAARGDHAATGDLARVRETEVNINYTATPAADNEGKTAQLIAGSVFGGGEAGTVKECVAVNMTGGLVLKDVYGGGALAHTQTSNWDATANNNAGGWADADKKSTLHTTTVRLTGGTVSGASYGGGLGQKTGVNGATSDIAAYVYGDVLLDLNGTTTMDDTTGKPTTAGTALNSATKGCVVGQIFGCNNINGSPKGDVMVHVYATQNKLTTTIAQKFIREKDCDTEKGEEETDEAYVTRLKGILTGKITFAEALDITVSQENKDLATSETATAAALKTAITGITTSIDAKTTAEINAARYDMVAVYGGGNMAAYVPAVPNTSTTSEPNGSRTQVIIEGCDETSIETVYGGGNAAAVPDTNVEIREAYEIQAVFGGGNGKDNLPNGDANPGADIGTLDHGTSTYGTGNANSALKGGYIHEAYGGSNTKGIVKGSLNQTSNPEGSCELIMDKIVGAGKYADIDGDVNMTLSCQPSTKVPELFAGADEANVNGNITLNITNGHFGKVFGGNNLGGAVKGKITVNVEETGCQPIRIDELYLGGNEAAYSVFGYYESEETHPVTGKKILKPRESATDTHLPVQYDGTSYASISDFTNYAQPELNIISCTYIGKVFGGGLGVPATMYANPTVNINMVLGTPNGVTSSSIGTIGDVYGGGNAAKIVGNTTVNIGTDENVLGANITGNVYGGGNLADVTGNTFVNICAKKDGDNYVAVAEGTEGVTIGGTVYGGGMGKEDTYFCEKAMIGENGAGADNPDYPNGNTSVRIGHGTVNGSVYGGGQVGRVEMNTVVEIGFGNGGSNTKSPVIVGNVFGAGAGVETHGYSALVRGNTSVTIAGDAWVKKSVYGGGEIASVARYKVAQSDEEGAPYGVEQGEPYLLENPNSGYCYVEVKGHAEIGTDGMKMYHPEIIDGSDKPDDWGHVFAAGKGVLPVTYNFDAFSVADRKNYPKRMALYDSKKYKASDENITWEYVDPDHKDTNKNIWEYFNTEKKYFTFIQTLGLATQTEATIGGYAFVKGSVYGGSENGIVQFNTNVTIEDNCQIGCGKNTTKRHEVDDPTVWDNYIPTDAKDLECASWDYGLDTNYDGKKDMFAPYDPNANAMGDLDKYPLGTGQSEAKSTEGGRRIATDGHTYYGNVFGGGSGSVPYFDTQQGISRYIMTAGQVKGNTNVTINGGHILTNVYGGCEATNVLGKATVKMTNGTIGVPRTAQQIKDHPVTCYLFGAGKGDQRVFFNKDTNVENVEVEITGGRIYGSVFGGGEDGHVMRDVLVTIGKNDGTGPNIGTTGTTYVDGNVFGGGRGFGGDALTAGNVGGTITLNIKGGNMLGSIYGGGRLASVGYGLYLTTETGFGDNHDDGYGKMQEDGYSDWTKGENGEYTRTAISGFERGYIKVNISGGTIGKEFASETEGAEHSGNVFGGSMGRLTKLDGSAFDDPNHWKLLATAKSATVKVTGGTIKRNVYGGGEMGTLTENTNVTISGGTIGTTGKGTDNYGNVYGGGKGLETQIFAGIVKGNTYVTVENGTNTSPTIYHNVYGGGAYGSVGTFTISSDMRNYMWTDEDEPTPNSYTYNDTGVSNVTITGGTIGEDALNGNVFGGGRGVENTFWCEKGIAYKANVTISNGTVKGNVYGGGEVGRVETNTEVKIGSGTGSSGGTAAPSIKGNVFGGGAGLETHGYSALVRGNTTVTVEGNAAVGNSVYGGGEIASVGKYGLDDDKMPSILLGGGECTVTVQGYATIGTDVFGAGKGVDPGHFNKNTGEKETWSRRMVTYTPTDPTTNEPHHTEGNKGTLWWPCDETEVTPVFVWEYFPDDTEAVAPEKRKTGEAKYATYLETLALATHPEVTIDGNTTVGRSVFGGGEVGLTKGSVDVNILGGTVEEDVYGGGALANTNTTSTVGHYNDQGNIETEELLHPTTTVNLLGGAIGGDAYGGGLGQKIGFNGGTSDVEATVYGDITVNLGTLETAATNESPAVPATATAFNVSYEDTDDKDESGNPIKVVQSGRVFGCNNLNGSPQGNVTVNVYKTVAGNVTRTADDPENPGRANRSTDVEHKYEVAAVYGGGNLANYSATGKKASVTIHTCNVSVQHVYGGGNAAAVPETDVLVKGAYEIEHVFGGGNGKDKYKKGNEWIFNAGADVSTNTNTLLIGGYIHEAYGGSNEKGTIGGNVTINTNSKHEDCACDLELVKLYGAGKNADIDGDLIVVLDCAPETKTEEIYGGAENANVRGNVELTITSGTFGKVFGGNNQSGAIFGHIILNIEETSCRPIIIDELYGCGNNAAYSVYGYKNGTDAEGNQIYVPRTSVNDGTAVTFNKDENQTAHTTPNPQYDDPEVNIISCTRIGKVFGGGLGSGAIVYGNPTVNIDQIPGAFATQIDRDGNGVADNNSDALGEIRDVFGGGNEANVVGNTNVNIGTKDKVWLHQSVDDTGTYTMSPALTEPGISVVGANITGNVYGGGNEAEVTGNTNVTIGKQSVTP